MRPNNKIMIIVKKINKKQNRNQTVISFHEIFGEHFFFKFLAACSLAVSDIFFFKFVKKSFDTFRFSLACRAPRTVFVYIIFHLKKTKNQIYPVETNLSQSRKEKMKFYKSTKFQRFQITDWQRKLFRILV